MGGGGRDSKMDPLMREVREWTMLEREREEEEEEPFSYCEYQLEARLCARNARCFVHVRLYYVRHAE